MAGTNPPSDKDKIAEALTLLAGNIQRFDLQSAFCTLESNVFEVRSGKSASSF